jgi:serine/threonine protein kinase/Tol biopolymer transport system component
VAIDPNTNLGHYEIRSQLGAGGMGEVYLAHDSRLGRSVALKLLPAEFTKDESRLRRFQQEARTASALNHPNILTIFEIGEVAGIHFIATELIEGETLRERMKRGETRLVEMLEIAVQSASALAAAHQAGIAHRDIKPENIMVRSDGYVKVLDFGLAKLTETKATISEASTLVNTEPGIVLGTAHYMSPEQARGLEVDTRTDIWSLGIVIYEMVSGQTPFKGTTGTDVIVAILEREPQPLRRHLGQLPTELEWIVKKALRKDRDERYQTAKDLQSDLKSLQRRLVFEAELERSVPPQLSSTQGWATNRKGADETAEQLAASTTDLEPGHSRSSAEYILTEIKKHKKGLVLVLGAVVLALLGLGAVVIFTFVPPRNSSTLSAVPPATKIARLTSTGRASLVAISPDGRYVVHVAIENGQESLRMRQVNTTSDVQIMPPADVQYAGLTFSRDGDFIYYVVSQKNSPTNLLYQIPVLGGAPRKLIEDVGSAVTLSPDGQQLAFIRDFPRQGAQALVIVNADGGNERKLAARKLPNFIKSLSWSPNGKTLACVAGSFVPSYNSYVVEVSLETGKEKPISSQAWLFMGQVAWLADGSGLILDASEQGSATFDSNQIWYLSYPGGEARRLTTDLNNYTSVSLTADSSRLVAVQSQRAANIWVVSLGDSGLAPQITRGVGQRDGWNGLAWTTDGKIIYASQTSGNDDLWIMSQDGSNQRQLTANARMNAQPAVSQDGRYFVFTSDRAGTSNIWRLDADGSNSKQLTSGTGENLAQCSPDGKWVLYTLLGSGKPTLWRVSMNGGAPQQLTDRFTSSPVISPDGRLIACFYREDQPNSAGKIALLPFEGGEPIKLFDVSTSIGRLLRWTPDGRALTYIVTASGISDVWSQPIDGGAPRQLTNFKTDQIFWFDWSRDGKQLAVARGSVASDVVLISSFR